MKEEERDDIFTQTKKETGLSVWEIMNAMRLIRHDDSFYDFDKELLAYQQKGIIREDTKKFAEFLCSEWKKAPVDRQKK